MLDLLLTMTQIEFNVRMFFETNYFEIKGTYECYKNKRIDKSRKNRKEETK